MKKNNYKEGVSLFVFLTTMTPYVQSFWLAQGVCLQGLNRHEDAIEIFKTAKLLKPADPIPLAYLIESYTTEKLNTEAKTEFDALKSLVESLEGDNKTRWEQKIKEINV